MFSNKEMDATWEKILKKQGEISSLEKDTQKKQRELMELIIELSEQ